MGVPGSANPLLLVSAAAAPPAAYTISRSVRLNSADSAYFSRTPSSAGNRKTWTWSGWVKKSRNNVGTSGKPQHLLRTSSPETAIRFEEAGSADSFRVYSLGTGGFSYLSTALFRDPSAWYHVVVAVDTTLSDADSRVKFWVNGVQITDFASSSNPSQNYETGVNNTTAHAIGAAPAPSEYFDGYLADVHFIDGQALDPTSFGEFDEYNNWQPKAYTGSYGTNGFHLDFSDATSTTTIAEDSSGNNNDWTANNISVTAGAGNDSLFDSPTNSGTDTGAGGEVSGNYATLNPLNTGATSLANGNLEVTTPSSGYGLTYGTIGVGSGKWYWEVTPTATAGAAEIGIAKAGATLTSAVGFYASGYSYVSSALKGNNNSYVSYGASYTTNDIIGVALDLDAGTLVFYKNGSSQGTAYSSLTGEFFPVVSDSSNGGGSTLVVNFGQRPFAYSAPSGFKALCTANLDEPTVPDGSTAMDVALYTGNGSTQTISGLGFSPDLVWIKSRSFATNHRLLDTVRGATKELYSSTTDAETTQSQSLTAFNSDGFSLGSLSTVNQSGSTFAAWTWDAGSSTVSNTDGSITSSVRANPTTGFSIVSYTGTGSNATVGHGLNAPIGMVIIKNRDDVKNWVVGHSALATGNSLRLNLTNAVDTAATIFNSTDPTSSVFSVGTNISVNGSGNNIIAYCFAPVEGYSAFGSYTGNGNTSGDGPFVYTGFRPKWLLVKESSNTNNWFLLDATRSQSNYVGDTLWPNLSNQENDTSINPNTTYNNFDFLSNGFKARSQYSGTNRSSGTFVYACFSEHPFRTSRAR